MGQTCLVTSHGSLIRSGSGEIVGEVDEGMKAFQHIAL